MAEPIAGSFSHSKEADAVRREAEAALGWQQVGHKIGATSRQIQARLGANGPFHSALFAERCQASGGYLNLAQGVLGIECEIAVKIANAPVNPPKTLYDAAEFIASVHPALELVGVRAPGGLKPDVQACIADFGLSVDFVYGPGVEPAALPDLASLPVTAYVNGATSATGSGVEVLGHPLNAIAYLAQALFQEGRLLRSRSWITTGTCVGIIPVVSGDHVVADFGPLGHVEAHFR
jgi:2-keto-4-pentenoate hydratase